MDHLGHVLHQSLSMDADVVRSRAAFMTKASDLRDKMFFAHPAQKMHAIQLYCCDNYGAMLWDLTDECTQKYFHAWNIQARNSWYVHPHTHTFLVEDFFCSELVSLRNQVYGRYPKFVNMLKSSPSREVRFLVNLVVRDPKSKTWQNLKYLNDITIQDDCLSTPYFEFKQLLPRKLTPPNEGWRTSLLTMLLEVKESKDYSRLNANETQVSEMIDSLCIS